MLHLRAVIDFLLRSKVALQRLLITHDLDHSTHDGHKPGELNGEAPVYPRLQLPLDEEVRIGKQNTSEHVVSAQQKDHEVDETEQDGERPPGRDICRQDLVAAFHLLME